MPWLWLLIAGLLEVVWAYALKQSEGFTRLTPSVVAVVSMVVSLGLLSAAMRVLPLGTAYMVWTGVGAVGAFVVGIAVLGEQASIARVIAAGLIAGGLVLMKWAAPD